MYKIFCDLCGQEIENKGSASKYRIERRYPTYGLPYDEELHLHPECDARLRNKVMEKCRKAIEVEQDD